MDIKIAWINTCRDASFLDFSKILDSENFVALSTVQEKVILFIN